MGSEGEDDNATMTNDHSRDPWAVNPKAGGNALAIGCLVMLGLFVVLVSVPLLFGPGGTFGPPAPPPHVATPQEIAAQQRQVVLRQAEQEQRTLREHPEYSLQLNHLRGRNGAFGTALFISGRIDNRSNAFIRDPRIRCNMAGASGTVIDTLRQAIYQSIPPGGHITFREIAMGFHEQQADYFNCFIEGATFVG